METKQKPPLFLLGQVLITREAAEALRRDPQAIQRLLREHASGNWGVALPQSLRANRIALMFGLAVESAHLLDEVGVIQVLTSGDRKRTFVHRRGEDGSVPREEFLFEEAA